MNRTIDIHAHVVPSDFPKWMGKHLPAGWPSMADAEVKCGCCHKHVMIDNQLYRTVSEKCWSTHMRLEDMHSMGLATQAISPMPELLNYWLDAHHAQALLRFINESIAEMAAESQGQLIGFAGVPLQSMDLALQELDYAINSLGMKGVELGSHINGIPLCDPSLRPFFEACVSLKVPVFVHALKPTGMERLVGPKNLQQVLAYPSDVGLAAAATITGNLLMDLPELKLAFSHGGGTFASLLPRLQQGWLTFPALADSMPVSPMEQAQHLFFDSLVFDSQTLRHLVSKFGAKQIMVGTDYPFNFHERHPVDAIKQCGFLEADTDALLYGNAGRFLGLQ